MPLILWDESRQAANAIEMYMNNNWIVTYYDNAPDLWNTKPPLLIWLQVIAMKIFGCSVTSLRSIPAIAGILTCVFIFDFLNKTTKNIWIGFWGGLILVSMKAYNGYHGTRTADYDALLTLFILLAIIQYYYYTNTFNKKNILLFFLFILLGTLTKGVAALLLLPALFLYTLISGKLIYVVKNRYFYIGCMFFLLGVGLYYFTREQLSPGYIEAVYMNELGGRYLEVIESHVGDGFFYFNYFLSDDFFIWNYTFMILIVLSPLLKSHLKNKNLIQYLFFLTIYLFAFLTTSKTKIVWYIMPVMPLIAAQISLLLFSLPSFLNSKRQIKFLPESIISFTLALTLSTWTYVKIAKLNDHPYFVSNNEIQFYRLSTFFHNNEFALNNIANLKVVHNSFQKQHLYFYVKRLTAINNKIDFADYMFLKKGDNVITSDESINEYILTNYKTNKIYNKDLIHIYSIQ